MCYCYRDTKMEMQGLTAARNAQQQHGVSCRAHSSRPGARVGTQCPTVLSKAGLGAELESHGVESDDNNNKRPGACSSVVEEDGSAAVLSALSRNEEAAAHTQSPGLQGRGPGKVCDPEHGEGELQMAFPVDLVQESHLQAALVQPADGGESLVCHTAAGLRSSAHARHGEDLYVLFNIAPEGNGTSDRDMGRPKVLGKDVHSFETKPDVLMEVQAASGPPQSGDRLTHLAPSKARSVSTSVALRPVSPKQSTEQSAGAAEDGGDLIVVNRNERCYVSQASMQAIVSAGELELMGQTHADVPGRSARKDRGASFTETAQLADGHSAFLSELNLASGSSTACGSFSGSATGETFSGTIMINNQNIVVTIENGLLTLAAPPDVASQKDDASGLFHFKEQLGIKEHQDIVLINYNSSSKSVGKNGSVAVGSIHYGESRSCLSGLSLEEDCSFSDPGSVLESCASAKEGAFCSMVQGDMVHQGSKAGEDDGLPLCDGDDLPSTKLSGIAGMMSKRGALVTYRCPQSDCSKTFDTKHKLKVHLLSHTEDQRPFKCPVEGCGWSFTTSYKLKRHLQSHDKVRPFTCEWENCGRKFTTVYNLKAHVKVHDQENAFVCEICSERFRSATRLGNHQRAHFEPERPHKCEFPGCEKTFITFSALFSHNRTHFRETGQFTCSYPGCDKHYDKACRLKIHLRSHTGERPFVCDSEGCGWSFTSMSKLLRHKRKHDDDRRFTCQQEGCGKSFTRAEHLKGHSITHLGTKPFECHVEGCSAKFSARSSLYIHSKKHQVDGWPLRTRCPVSTCSKHFSSRSSLRSHMLKLHRLSPDLLSQLEMSTSLTPSSELTSAGPTAGDMDLGSLFSSVSGGAVGVPAPSTAPALTMDMAMVSSGMLTIDAASVGATLGNSGGALAQTVDPLILTAGAEVGAPGFEGGTASVLPQGTLSLEDVQTVNPEALGSLAALALRAPSGPEHLHALTSSSTLASEPPVSLAPTSSLAAAPAAQEVEQAGGAGALLGDTDVLGQQEGSNVVTQFVFPGHAGTFSSQKEAELHTSATCSFLESGGSPGSARTDYRAIQLAKKKKLKCPAGSPGSGQRKSKGVKGAAVPGSAACGGGRFHESVSSASGGLTLRDPVTGTQYVQIQLLQDDPAGDGDLAFQLSSQTSSSHSQLTVDLPVNILQEPPATGEDDTGSDTSQFTGSTINLQDLE